MAIVSQGNSVVVDLGPTDAIWIKSTGNAAVLVNQTFAGTPDSFNVTTDVQRVGYYGEPVQVTIRAVTGQAEYQDQQFSIQPLTSTQMGGKADSSATDIALAVNAIMGGNVLSQQQTVVLYGDSYTDAQQSQNALFLGECLSISAWRFVFGRYGDGLKIVGNAAMAGSDSAELLARLPQVLAVQSDWVFMNIGANDFYNASFTAETVFNNMTAAILPLIKQGRKVLLLAAYPQLTTRASYSAAKALESQKYNRMMANWCATHSGSFWVDTYQNSVDWADTANAGGLAKDFITDGIHVSITAGIETMNACAKVLDQYIPQQRSLELGPTLPTVIGVGKSVLAGTAGTNGTGSSGQVASLFTASRSAGANGTIVASKLLPVGQRLTITLGATNGLSTFRFFTGANSALAAVSGKTIATRTKMRARTTSGTAFLRQMSTRLFASDGVTNFNQYNGRVQGSFPTSAMVSFDTGEIVLDTFPLLIPETVTGSSGYYFEIEMDSTAGATVEIDFYGIDVLEKVIEA